MVHDPEKEARLRGWVKLSAHLYYDDVFLKAKFAHNGLRISIDADILRNTGKKIPRSLTQQQALGFEVTDVWFAVSGDKLLLLTGKELERAKEFDKLKKLRRRGR